MDGNHMLICWRFVVHGCIDGYSRTVLYLKCVTNSAEPVLSHFQDAILRFRCQLRIQYDYDTEHKNAARWILNHHGDTQNLFFLICQYIINASRDYGWTSEFMFCSNSLTGSDFMKTLVSSIQSMKNTCLPYSMFTYP